MVNRRKKRKGVSRWSEIRNERTADTIIQKQVEMGWKPKMYNRKDLES